MAISAEQLAKSLNAAQHLMSSEGQQKINEARNNFADSGYNTTPYEYDYNTIIGGQYIQENTQRSTGGNMTPSNSKLPQAIVESMMNHQIDTSCLDPNGMTNVMKLVEQNAPQVKKQVIKEDKVIPSAASGIDYSLIKTIVNECISSQMENIKQTLLNESTVKAFTIKDGNKVQFLSKNGDLYEGELKLKKRKTK